MNQRTKNTPEAVEQATVAEQIPPEPPILGNPCLFLPDKRKPGPSAGESRRALVIGGGIVLVLILFTWSGLSCENSNVTSRNSNYRPVSRNENQPPSDSVTPILDIEAPVSDRSGDSSVDAEQLARTASKKINSTAPATIADVPPFSTSQPWQAPAYSDAAGAVAAGASVPEREAALEKLDQSSLVFAAREASSPASGRPALLLPTTDREVRLEPGTRLRARLEAAISSAVHAPVVAVVEYDYEQAGRVVIPAGAKILGRLENADRSGYVEVRFDSLAISDMPSLHLEGVATDLQLRPLRGRVEGSNRGKNLFVRSLAGLGQTAATLAGRGNFDQPLSEGDLLRERLSNNIGQAADQQLAGAALSQQIVVTIAAGTEIYVVLEKQVDEPEPANRATIKTSTQPSVEELRQLLQLQRELNETAPGPPQ